MFRAGHSASFSVRASRVEALRLFRGVWQGRFKKQRRLVGAFQIRGVWQGRLKLEAFRFQLGAFHFIFKGVRFVRGVLTNTISIILYLYTRIQGRFEFYLEAFQYLGAFRFLLGAFAETTSNLGAFWIFEKKLEAFHFLLFFIRGVLEACSID